MSGRGFALVLAIGGLVASGGCGGGGSSSSPSSVPTPTPAPATTTLGQGTFRADARTSGAIATITLNQTGVLATTIRWTFASNDVDLFVVSGTTCSTHVEGVPTGTGCSILCRDVGTTGTTATCSFNATTGSALVWVTNYGSTSESGTWVVTLTR